MSLQHAGLHPSELLLGVRRSVVSRELEVQYTRLGSTRLGSKPEMMVCLALFSDVR